MQSLKSLFVTLLFLGGAFLAYDRYLAPEKDKLVFKLPPPAKPEPAAPGPSSAETAVVSPAPTPTVAPAPEPAPPLPPVAAMPPVTPAPLVAPADGFVPPRIPSVEDATLNWSRIPASAFPRKVKLLQPATFKAGFGSSEVLAGTPVTVLSADDGRLTIAPAAASPLRAVVPIDATDLKTVRAHVYDEWRGRRIAEARRAWENRDATTAAAPAPPATLDATGRPHRGVDGSYPLLLASMKSGAVTDITPQSIKRWGDAEKGEADGKPCWIVPVEFEALTAFGKFHTEAIARIVDGRVAGWYYKGSGEVVP
jgi:hypothetical protein